MECRSISQYKHKPQNCKYCGKQFTAKNWTAKYCSRHCRDEARCHGRVERKCKTCGLLFIRAAALLKNHTYTLDYCSILCKNRSPEQRRAASNNKLGDKNPMKRPDVAARVSLVQKTKYGAINSQRMKKMWADGKVPKIIITEEMRIGQSKRMLGDLNPMRKKDVADKARKAQKLLFQNDEHRLRILMSQRTHPNRLERGLTQMLGYWGLSQLEFHGDRTFWIGPCKSGLCRNPDFIDRKNKKIILTCGRHWHTETSIQIQINDYVDKGYKVLIIWDNDFDELGPIGMEEKIRKFAVE